MAKDLRDLAGFGSATVDSNQLAEAFGFLAWTGDPRDGVQQGTDTSGSAHGVGIWLPQGIIVSRIAGFVSSAGVGMTHGQYGLLDVNFNVVAQSADSPTAFQTTGWIELPMASSYTTPYAGLYYVSDCLSTGTTMPTCMNTGSDATTALRALLPNGAFRYFNQTGLTVFPAQVTPSTSGLCRVFTVR